MRKLLVVGLVVLSAVASSTPAAAMSKGSNELESQITTLQRQVRALQRQVNTLKRQHAETRLIAIGSFQFGICVGAITADAFRGTWTVIDQVAQASEGKTYIGPQPTVNDQGICADNDITRSQAVPPNMSVFSALYALLGASSVSYRH